MSPGRALGFGVLALAVVAGALFVSSQRQMPRATLVGERVVPGLAESVNEVNEIRIARGDGTVTTLRREDSGEWQVQERRYRADVAKLRRLLLDSAALAVVEEKTREAANYAALGVDEPDHPSATGTLLEIKGAQQSVRLIVGRNSGMKSSFVRLSGSQGSALATPQLVLDAQPSAWLDHQLFDLPPERVKSVTRTPVLAAAKNPALAPPDPAFAAFAFDDLRSVAVAAPPGAAPPQLDIETKDGMVVTLSGERDQDKRYIAVTARALEGAEPKVHREASELAARAAGVQFELPVYRYDSLFPPAPAPVAAPPKKARKP
jgi:Domain of unknown function (DUF4340)